MARPLIAVPAYWVRPGRVSGWRAAGAAAPAPYLEALQRAGAAGAVLMPVELAEEPAGALIDRFDGLLLLGGGDLDPKTYGAHPVAEVYGVTARRDSFELALARAALDAGVPIFGVCRGHQVLNVALGGTLHQHLASGEDGVSHGLPGVEGGATMHPVRVEPGSRVAGALGVDGCEVSSHHHQAIDGPGAGLTTVAWADDGIVEGVELGDSDTWVVGVQWHPEDTAATDPVQQRLFDTFVTEAARPSR